MKKNALKMKILKFTSFNFVDLLMEELEWASKNGILSTDQYDIFVERYNG